MPLDGFVTKNDRYWSHWSGPAAIFKATPAVRFSRSTRTREMCGSGRVRTTKLIFNILKCLILVHVRWLCNFYGAGCSLKHVIMVRRTVQPPKILRWFLHYSKSRMSLNTMAHFNWLFSLYFTLESSRLFRTVVNVCKFSNLGLIFFYLIVTNGYPP